MSEIEEGVSKKVNRHYGEFPCPECPRVFMLDGYRRRHIKAIHKSRKLPAVIQLPVQPQPEFKRINGFILLEDTKGSIWLAERIR